MGKKKKKVVQTKEVLHLENEQLLREVLHTLSESQEILKDSDSKSEIIKKINKIYNSDFRHLYSDIFSTLSALDRDNPAALENLGGNVEIIYREYRDDKKNTYEKRVVDSVKKLYDHVALDISRINYIKTLYNNSKGEKETLLESINQTKNDVSVLSEEAKASQRDYVTILGIFAAIILTFISGLLFSSSVLKNMSSVNIYRLLFVTIIVAAICFTMLMGLYKFLCTVKLKDFENYQKVEETFKRIYICLVILLILLIISWFFDIVSIRNKLVQK